MLIAIDHGNKLIKVSNHEPFTSGLEESEVPPFAGETLKYQGKYYTRSEKRTFREANPLPSGQDGGRAVFYPLPVRHRL